MFNVPMTLSSPQGVTVCRTAVLGAGVILLFSSRACYNLAVLVLSRDHQVEAFDYNWYNISDQVCNSMQSQRVIYLRNII